MPAPNHKIIFRRPRYAACEGWILIGQALDTAARVLRSDKRAEQMLVSRLLDGSLRASTRCVMVDYDVFPVPTTTPDKKGPAMRSIWFSSEGQHMRLPILGLPQVSKDRAISIDFLNSILVCAYPPPRIMLIDTEDGEVTIQPGRREVRYKIEVEVKGLESLLLSMKRERSASTGQPHGDPEADDYRVKLSESEWTALLAPLIELSRKGRLADEFGVIGYGGKQKVKDHILTLLQSAGHTASTSTLLRKCNKLIEMNGQAISRFSGPGADERT